MTYKVIIPQSLYLELNDAALYYESKSKGLGVSFVLHWEDAMGELKHNPEHYQRKHKDFRGIKLKKFPYVLIFEIIENKVYVYRLIHAHSNPKKMFNK